MSATNQDADAQRGWNQGPWGGSQGPWGGSQGPQWQQPDHGAAYAGQKWGTQNTGPSWGNPAWGKPPFWYPAGFSRSAAIAFTILGFLFWWPVGLAMLIYTIRSGRLRCVGSRRQAMNQQNWQDAGKWANWKNWTCGPSVRAASTSGNRAFDEYKAETLRRMEEEQEEFGSFLERLRFAKDKSEFDQFMAERRGRPPAPLSR